MFQFFCEKYPPDVVNRVLDGIRVDVSVGQGGCSDQRVQADNAGNRARAATTHHADATAASSFASTSDLDGMKVGRIANEVLRAMLEEGAATADEVADMQTASYSRTAFDLNFPLLVPVDGTYPYERYYKKPLVIDGREYKLCSQWFENASNNDRPYLTQWIREHKAD